MRSIPMLLTLLLGASLVACGSGPQPQVASAPQARAPAKEVVQMKVVALGSMASTGRCGSATRRAFLPATAWG